MVANRLYRNSIPRKNREKVLSESGGICAYCGDEAQEVDHIIPWSHSHNHRIENLVATCKLCNLSASNKVFDFFEAKKEYILNRRKRFLNRGIALWLRSDYDDLGDNLKTEIDTHAIIVDDINSLIRVKEDLKSRGFRVFC